MTLAPLFRVCDRVVHPEYGLGTVKSIGDRYVEAAFDVRYVGLLPLASSGLRLASSRDTPALTAPASDEHLPWPESTFKFEKPGTHHFLGSHWDPFVDDVATVMKRLPEIAKQWLMQSGFGDNRRKPPRQVPADWPRGWHYAWPLRLKGLMATLRIGKKVNEVVTLFPFFAEGSQHTMRLDKVAVWEGGCEAHITAHVSEAEITFFDTKYFINREWYEAGRTYDFILTGIAYAARYPAVNELKIKHSREVLEFQARLAREHGVEPDMNEEQTLSLAGSAVFFPVEGWDEDEYTFRGPVQSVREVKDVLGQDGWLVRATVLRLSTYRSEDVPLSILITTKAWREKEPPQIGRDIEGRLWLQGYLWYPHNYSSIGY